MVENDIKITEIQNPDLSLNPPPPEKPHGQNRKAALGFAIAFFVCLFIGAAFFSSDLLKKTLSSLFSFNINQSTNITDSVVNVASAKTITQSAVPLVVKTFGYCKALAPQDWAHISNKETTGADLFSPDKILHAGWGIAGVYTYMYPTEEDFLQAWLSYAYTGSFSNSISMGEIKNIDGGFIQKDFATTTDRKGVIIYKTYRYADPTMYVVSVYMADAPVDAWEEKGALPFSVALTIRCVSQLRPTTNSVDYSNSDSSKADDNPEVSLSEKWTEAIMGFENVYSPTTGEHYEAPLNSKWETGPEGSAYYRDLPGGGYEKLEPGFGDY